MRLNFRLQIYIGKNTDTEVSCTSTAINVKIFTVKGTDTEITDIDLARFIESELKKILEPK